MAHLNEARRFFGELALPTDLADAARLDGWLVEVCKRKRTNNLSRREVQRYVTPIHLRQKKALTEALHELAEVGRISIGEGRRKIISVNPALITGDSK
jgi:putative DNA primase/helicase